VHNVINRLDLLLDHTVQQRSVQALKIFWSLRTD